MNNPSPLEAIRAKWKDHPAVRAAAGELTNMEDDLARLREAEDPEERKAYRLLWQRAAHQYCWQNRQTIQAISQIDRIRRTDYDEKNQDMI